MSLSASPPPRGRLLNGDHTGSNPAWEARCDGQVDGEACSREVVFNSDRPLVGADHFVDNTQAETHSPSVPSPTVFEPRETFEYPLSGFPSLVGLDG